MSDSPSSTDQDSTSDRVPVPLDEAIERLADNDGQVHTLRDAGVAMIGADWDRDTLVAAMQKHGVEESGPAATAARHGLVLIDEHGPLFIETREVQP